MNQYLKGLLVGVAIIVISVVSCCLIIDGFPYGPEDCTEIYHSQVLILKGIIVSGAIIAYAISLTAILKK